jgi:hypothetical protein
VSYPRGTSLLRLNIRTAIARMVLHRARTRRLNGIALDRSRLEACTHCGVPFLGADGAWAYWWPTSTGWIYAGTYHAGCLRVSA